MQMSNRTAKFVSAMFACFLASAPFATVSHGAAPATDECLSGPKGQAPQGGHWYYRVDRATKRHCWYVGDEREKPSKIAARNSAPAAKPISRRAETAIEPSIAEAHAELPAQMRVGAETNAPTQAMPANTAAREDNGALWTSPAEAQRSLIASRWPEPSSAASSSAPAPAPAPTQRDASVSANSTTPTQPPSVLAAEQLAAADSSETSAYSVPVLLAALLGALALAGITAGAIFKFSGTRRPAQAKVRERRGVNWESANTDGRMAYPGAGVPSRRTTFVRDLDQAGNERIAEFFSQLAKRTPG
jgi:hypothetical protein